MDLTGDRAVNITWYFVISRQSKGGKGRDRADGGSFFRFPAPGSFPPPPKKKHHPGSGTDNPCFQGETQFFQAFFHKDFCGFGISFGPGENKEIVCKSEKWEFSVGQVPVKFRGMKFAYERGDHPTLGIPLRRDRMERERSPQAVFRKGFWFFYYFYEISKFI